MSSRVPVAGLLVLAAACGAGEPRPAEPPASTGAALSTWVGATRYLEIDRVADSACAGGAPDGTCARSETAATCPTDCGAKAADANLYVGPDPADQSPSQQRPACVGAGCTTTFIDWADTPRARDVLDTFSGADPSAFPSSSACIGAANNPPKQELTAAALASNRDYGYLALARQQANGNSAYFWTLNKIAPTSVAGPVDYLDLAGALKSCKALTSLLRFDLSVGDVLLVGEFEPSAGATIMRVFRVKTARAATDARSVTDFDALTTAGVYEELTASGVAAAINTTVTTAGGFGGTTGTLSAALFSEVAVPMTVLAPGGACGRSVYATAISKTSTSASSDLKDLIGPLAANLGVVTPSVTFAPTCDSSARYAVTATAPDGAPLSPASMTCTWTFTTGSGQVSTRAGCSGWLAFPAGTVTAEVVVTDAESGCASLAAAGTVGPIVVGPTAASACEAPTCDPATGVVTSTPKAAGVVCRASLGPCDPLEVCDGASPTCPFDVRSTAVCRASQGACDPAERCDGTSAQCPSDARAAPEVVCRDATGPCDVAETCDGASAACPSDALAKPGTTCRASLGECDPAEVCTGDAAFCPPDVVVARGTGCADDGNPCTLDACDGGLCGHPAGHAGATCRAAAGPCDAPELCRGNTPTCPPDERLAGVVCRAAAGPCDAAELCDGNSAACQHDRVRDVGEVCRTAVGACDLAETCDGNSVDCPADARAAAGHVCRSAVGECDLDEACDGSGADCPPDAFQPAATACHEDDDPCTVAACDGAGACALHAGNAGAVCRAPAGDCDEAERCDGVDAGCPADAFVSGDACRPAAGPCDVVDVCVGDSRDCPPDTRAEAGTECRVAAGACDVAEACDGSSDRCPLDLLSTAECRVADGPCDVAERCDGDHPACPPDGFATGGECRAAVGPCDVPEACDGAGRDCPDDGVAPAGTACADAVVDCFGPTCDGLGKACPPRDGACADGDRCTIDDACADGVCGGEADPCDAPLVFFLVVTNARGAAVGSVRCTHAPGLTRCATRPPDPADPGLPILDVRPELMCGGEP